MKIKKEDVIVGTCVGCFILIAFATGVCAVAALAYLRGLLG